MWPSFHSSSCRRRLVLPSTDSRCRDPVADLRVPKKNLAMAIYDLSSLVKSVIYRRMPGSFFAFRVSLAATSRCSDNSVWTLTSVALVFRQDLVTRPENSYPRSCNYVDVSEAFISMRPTASQRSETLAGVCSQDGFVMRRKGRRRPVLLLRGPHRGPPPPTVPSVSHFTLLSVCVFSCSDLMSAEAISAARAGLWLREPTAALNVSKNSPPCNFTFLNEF